MINGVIDVQASGFAGATSSPANLAFVCIVSVMLGVGILIVVNGVMTGFSTKLKDRLHGLLSDVIVESRGLEGFADPQTQDRSDQVPPLPQGSNRGDGRDDGSLRHVAVQ